MEKVRQRPDNSLTHVPLVNIGLTKDKLVQAWMLMFNAALESGLEHEQIEAVMRLYVCTLDSTYISPDGDKNERVLSRLLSAGNSHRLFCLAEQLHKEPTAND